MSPIPFTIQKPKAVSTTKVVGSLNDPEIIEKDQFRYTIYSTNVSFKLDVRLTKANSVVFVTEEKVNFADRPNISVAICVQTEAGVQEVPVKTREVLEDGKWRLVTEKPEKEKELDITKPVQLKVSGKFRVGGMLEEFISTPNGMRVNVFKLEFSADRQDEQQAKTSSGSPLGSYDIPMVGILTSIGIPATDENELRLNG